MMQGDTSKGANHEYYVTASYNGSIKGASQVNVNVQNPDAGNKSPAKPKAPSPDSYKKPLPSKNPNPSQNDKPDKSGKIIDVKFINRFGKAFTTIPEFGETIIIEINTANCIGKRYNLNVWEHDTFGKNDLLYFGNHKISKDSQLVSYVLTKERQQIGEIGNDKNNRDSGEYTSEFTDHQEIFAEIVFADLTEKSETLTVEVLEAYKYQEPAKSPAKVKQVAAKKPKEGECFCNRDFEIKDVKEIVKLLKGSETIWEGQALEGGKRAECNISDKSFATLTKEINNAFKTYKINTCAQKMHFLAQICEETGTFALSEETRSKYLSSQSTYKGRGILQLTGVKTNSNDKNSLYNKPGPYKDYAEYKNDQNIVSKPEIVANNVHYAIDSGAWIWSVNKRMTSNPKSDAIKRWGMETLNKSLNELAVYVDKYLELIAVLLNGRNASTNMPNGWEKRKSNYKLLKTGFFKYDYYHGTSASPIKSDGIVTYHIHADGNIEKYVPKTIKDEFKQKYKYVYHDKNNKEHEICTVKFIFVDKRADGITINAIPRGYTKTYNYPQGGNAQKAYMYANGDICVEGTRYGFKKYPKGTGKVELVRMEDSLSYNNAGVNIYYTFHNSQRKYCNPESYAGFIGALAELGRTDVLCTGMCFEDATSYPSVTHPNGDSADTAYYSTQSIEQKKVDALKKYHFKNIYRGNTSWYPNLVGTRFSRGHEDHLHAGDFDISILKTINEK